MNRIISLLRQFPLITLLTVFLFCSMMSLIIVTTENSDLKQKLSDAQSIIPAAKECSDKVELIAKDCKVEVQAALLRIKPVIKYIDKPAKSAGEFNEWVREL